ncbi:MAG: type I-E CRISPR-associated protein Cas5/CasD [Treponema sp.]|nr:type I-E CRISPR-associated protein Cas5/CasD [Treponema sp.]
METKFLLLWLEAPLQSWGFDSKFGRRDTLGFPTKSGVLGLLLCALGAGGEQRELLARFAGLRQTVISFRDKDRARPLVLHDFQMIGAGYDDKDKWEKHHIPKTSEGKAAVGGGTKMTHRYYLQDAVFAVILEIPADIADACAGALKNPVWPLFLGRRCCVPSDFVYQGTFGTESDAEAAAMQKALSHESRKLLADFRVVDGESEDGDAFTLNDVPVQFGRVKKYQDRRVTKILLNMPDGEP